MNEAHLSPLIAKGEAKLESWAAGQCGVSHASANVVGGTFAFAVGLHLN
jgi:hypothetical protein